MVKAYPIIRPFTISALPCRNAYQSGVLPLEEAHLNRRVLNRVVNARGFLTDELCQTHSSNSNRTHPNSPSFPAA